MNVLLGSSALMLTTLVLLQSSTKNNRANGNQVLLCPGNKHYNNMTGECTCTNRLQGGGCNKTSSLCGETTCHLACSTLVLAAQRCASRDEQFYVRYSSGTTTQVSKEKVESDVKSVYMNVTSSSGSLLTSPRSRLTSSSSTSLSDVAVEMINRTRLPEDVIFRLVMFSSFNSSFINQDDVCDALSQTNLACLSVSDCPLLVDEGLFCPFTYKVPFPPVPVFTGGVIALLVAAGMIVIILLAGYITMKICKYKRKRESTSTATYNYGGTTEHGTRSDRYSVPALPQVTADMSRYNNHHHFNSNSFGDDSAFHPISEEIGNEHKTNMTSNVDENENVSSPEDNKVECGHDVLDDVREDGE